MNLELVDAIRALREKSILSEAQAARLSRVARGEIVSVRPELRLLLYAGVALVVSGVGLFLKENHDRLGPAVIVSLLSAATLSCFVFLFRRSPPFSWGEFTSAHVAADYVLLLGLLLGGSDLAYIEAQFHFLGASWPYHLLVLSLVAFVAAYRFDSRPALSLALSSFAAWRGLSKWFPLESLLGDRTAQLRVNAFLCAGLFLAAAWISFRAGKKAHFEPVFAAFGWLLLFGGLLSGVFQDQSSWPLWTVATGVAATLLIVFAYRSRRVFDFGVGVIAGYLALIRLWGAARPGGQLFFFVVAASSLGIVVLLAGAYRTMRAER
jgi:hypothetical protein